MSPDPMSPDPISDEALASVRRAVESPVLRSDPGGVPIVALREVDAAALLARLDAAEADAVPDGWKVSWLSESPIGPVDIPRLVPADTEKP